MIFGVNMLIFLENTLVFGQLQCYLEANTVIFEANTVVFG